MLNENDVIEKVTEFLESKGYNIKQSLTTNQRGIDIIAETDSESLFIEAKGETSSVKSSKRYERPFNRNQIKTHISVALLATMKVISSLPAGDKTKVGIALPDTEEQRKVINDINCALSKLNIRICWVGKSKVTVE